MFRSYGDLVRNASFLATEGSDTAYDPAGTLEKQHQWTSLDNSFPSGHSIVTRTAGSTIAHEYPKPWLQRLTYGTATALSVTRFTSLQHFPSDVVVGSTLWLFDRTAYFPRTLPGWPESRVQEKMRETNSAGEKGEVNDAEELAVHANWRFCLVLCRLCACSSHSSSERSDLNRNN